MLEVAQIREHKDAFAKALQKRNLDTAAALLDQVLAVDETRRTTQSQLDQILADSNNFSKEIGILFKNGEAQKANLLKEKTAGLRDQSKELQEKLNTVSDELKQLLYVLPNIPHESVPEGNSDEDNEEIFRKGEVPVLHEGAQPHWELAKKYDIIDFELGAKVTGAGFPVYKGKGARLQRALISYFLDKNTGAGYTEYQVPHLVNEASGYGTGQLPDKEGQMYHVTGDDLYLIPTAEVPLTNLVRDEIVDEAELPMKMCAHTPCFRSEAGSSGRDIRGLIRQHQFDKVEMVQIVKPENSFTALDELTGHAEKILEKLELPYRTVILCTGDIGFSATKTFDIEVWLPAQNTYREISSCSNMGDFQARRMQARFRNSETNKPELLHTLNGSGLAVGRTLVAVLENYQQEDGSINVPTVLQPYMKGLTNIR